MRSLSVRKLLCGSRQSRVRVKGSGEGRTRPRVIVDASAYTSIRRNPVLVFSVKFDTRGAIKQQDY